MQDLMNGYIKKCVKENRYHEEYDYKIGGKGI
jgi:hypothetical protein